VTDTATVEKLKREWLKPFVEGVMTTLTTMASLESSVKGIVQVQEDTFSGDVSAVMGITGKEGEGFVGISFGTDLANVVVSKILGLEASELEPSDINDGVGELINMIAGSAKNTLLGTPYEFQIALPNVITGSGHQVGFPKDANCWTTTFECAGQEFYVHVAYAPL